MDLSLAQALSKHFMFMDQFYGELYNTYGISKDKAWHLVSLVISQFFGYLYAVQRWAKYIPINQGKTEMIGGAYICTSLQAHSAVMAEYLEADFCHHQSMAPVITIHL
jgi:hypothetical protein